jgi:serine/threonine protein kinase
MEMAWAFPMELMLGGDLLDRLTKDEHYSETVARRFVRQLAEAIAFMHSRGVVHRDLKLENLMLSSPDQDAVIKLSDFDLSCFVSDARSLGEACGTPGYVAPEIIRLSMGERDAPGVSFPCDIWSFGVIAYILLCGHPPFDMDNDDVGARDTLAGNWSFPEDIWAGVSAQARDLVARMLRVNPSERITAEQVLQHPWFGSMGLGRSPLVGAHKRLSKFMTHQKWKVAIKAISAAAFMNKLAVGPTGGTVAAPRRLSNVQLSPIPTHAAAPAPPTAPHAPVAAPTPVRPRVVLGGARASRNAMAMATTATTRGSLAVSTTAIATTVATPPTPTPPATAAAVAVAAATAATKTKMARRVSDLVVAAPELERAMARQR